MNKVAIVILNYQSYNETENCVESILDKKLDIEGIVIVDNASENESYTYLKQKYGCNKKIKIVRSNKNVGFAKGNNIGIRIAKAIWNAEFILLLNSDTVILEEDYIKKLLSRYRSGIGVMQTSVLRLNGRYTQKNYGTYAPKRILLDGVKTFCRYYNLYFPERIGCRSENILGPWVSGCDIFLTPDYFEIYQGLYPLTFLYGEEYILAIMLKKAGLEWKVVEEAHILHAESRSTPMNFREGTHKKKKMMLGTIKHKLFVSVIPLKVICYITNRGKR